MKANPDNRWRKMPPGSAESLPPSNAKPYTPSLSNGVSGAKLLTAAVSSLQAQAEPGMDQDQLAQPPPSAPKDADDFAKRAVDQLPKLKALVNAASAA